MLPLLLVTTLSQDPPSLPARVNRAIARGVSHLRSKQLADGSFPGHETDHPGGMTALCAFTLRKSGVGPKDDAFVRAMAALEKVEFESVYSHTVRLLLFDSLRDPRLADEAQESLRFLVESQQQGRWAYPWGDIDASNTQFALLGLRAARRLGLDVPEDTVAEAARALFDTQTRSGGVAYSGGRAETAGITAATAGGLAILAEFAPEMRSVDKELRRRKDEAKSAEAWLAKSFDAEHNRYGADSWTPTFHFPYLWAVERWGGITERDRLGDHDWYAEGAEYLVGVQHADGGWGRTLEDACFALLFLRRATTTGSQPFDLSAIDTSGAAAKASNAPRRPRDAVAPLRDWLVAGPWRGKPGEGLVERPPFRPDRVRVKAKAKVKGEVLAPIHLGESGWTDLEQVTGRGGDALLWLVAGVLTNSSTEPVEAVLWLTVEDGSAVWLDGERVFLSRRVQAPIEETIAVPFTVPPGEHALVVLVEDVLGVSAFAARLADADGRALESVAFKVAR